ncbi:MAG: SURF1 family protein [bacterium]|nr:SURF1 family protein [bacterium]MDE0352673.1 SURF1 family protein [bacterium]
MRIAVRPRWIVFSVLVVVVAVACVFLGFWQLSRLEERRASNAVLIARLAREPIPLEDLRAGLRPEQGIEVDPADYEHTRVTATGRLTDRGRVLVRSQVVRGQAGVHGVYAMELDDGAAVLVNVGWFPIGSEIGPIADAYGESGQIELTGLVRADQERPALGRAEPPGLLDTVARIDIDRIQQQVESTLLPFWIQLVEPDDADRLPIPVPLPEAGEGSHLSYAVQWFSFGAVAVIGYVALMRRELRPGRRRKARAGD